ncbi:tetratricopeptide repeat protein [Hyphomicrobium methylovorum]|uniref:tetratricopeptide repeat protein n=1 Tax=Hyphomicrobium methylovorum TaxID=84 RepID=UPI001AEEB3BB|nr:cytochrome C biogenesis protein [Hyphomicrobium methylovorum]
MKARLSVRQLVIGMMSIGIGAAASVVLIPAITHPAPLTVYQLTGPLNSGATTLPTAIKGIPALPSLLVEKNARTQWEIIGGTLLQTGFANASISALERAIANDPENIMLHVALGEAIVIANGGWVNARAKAEFDIALRADPNDLIARFYLAHWLMQSGKPKPALVKWVGLMRTVGTDEVWYDKLWEAMPGAAEQLGISKLALQALCSAGM